MSKEQNQDTRAEIERQVQAQLERLPDLDKSHLRQQVTAELIKLWARDTASQIHGIGSTTSYAENIQWAGDVLRRADERGPTSWVFQDIADINSTNLVVAPTNAGGSTFQGHAVYCLLTGQPLLSLFATNVPDDLVVIWLNPEEQEEEPIRRLKRMGITKKTLDTRVLSIFTKHQKLYVNRQSQVQMLLADLAAKDILDDPRPKALIVDGFRPSLTGDEWGKDLEDWKEGMGTLITALNPLVTFVRTQVGASTARLARKGKIKIDIEDALGGQIAQWADNRFTINYVFEGKGKSRQRSENRELSVRGRMRESELSAVYEFDEDTWHLTALDGRQQVKALAIVGHVVRGQSQGSLPTSQRGLAAFILEDWSANGSNPPSDRSMRRVISDAYAYSAEGQVWESKL